VSTSVWPKRDAGLFPDNGSRGAETVLVVEDEPAVRGLVESVLGLHGYQVIGAGNAGDALELSTSYEGRIDLLLTDVEMPDMSGRELAQRLRAERTEMRLLYMSGHDEDDVAGYGVVASGGIFLPKPFTVAALTERVRKVIDGQAL
jgi:two-component system cell cycle sensor histidine kinase/response regulator CckA